MEGIAEEHEPGGRHPVRKAHRRDPASERLAAREDRGSLRALGRLFERGEPGVAQRLLRVGRFPSSLLVVEVETEGADAVSADPFREPLQERVIERAPRSGSDDEDR